MSATDSAKQDNKPINPVIHYALQLVALAILLVWCFQILQSFIIPLVWGGVLAITLYPLHRKLSSKMRNAWSATIITIATLALIVAPAVLLMLATVGEFKELANAYRAGELHIPPPNEKVKDWPLIGSTAYSYWTEASNSLGNFIVNHKDQAKSVLLQLFDLFASTGKGILVFALSVIISGVMLAYAEPAGNFAHSLLVKLAGKTGETMTTSADRGGTDVDALEAMETCRAIRYLKPDPLPDEVIGTILHAATRAPSPGNTQEWDFIVVDDADLRRRIGDAVAPNLVPRVEKMPRADRTARLMLDGVEHMARTLSECPVIVLVCGPVTYPASAPMEKFTWSALYPAAQNLIVAARALGVGSVFTTIHLNAEPEIRSILGIPDEVLIAATIPLGWPDAAFGPVRRRPLEDFVHRNGWQGRLRG